MNTKRVRPLNNNTHQKGTVVYWMSRDQRVHDNWALIYAQQLAQKHNTTFSVCFCLRKEFDCATERLVDFMIKGLEEVSQTLTEKQIPFHFIIGEPTDEIPRFIKEQKVGAMIGDFSPLRYNRAWKKNIAEKISIPFYEVDAHNIVPVWEASTKQEFGAYTIRPKIGRLLPEFLEEFPEIKKQETKQEMPTIDWIKTYDLISVNHSVPKVDWIISGEKQAQQALQRFIANTLQHYATDRNDPNKDAQSNLSPYIHFGHISSQRIALKIQSVNGHTAAKDAYLEELIIRKELSDNYCYYNHNYDSPKGFPDWAIKTLSEHKGDTREYVYTLAEFEQAKTHDPLWNAAQQEMIKKGKMHGYMRMYWAKKIFEWSATVETAQKHAIYLNDKYFLDGRDPNGYTGIAWSMGGVHDRAWFERTIFGKIRYMNYNGAKSKFNIDGYIKRLV